jgi:hypothetical protein
MSGYETPSLAEIHQPFVSDGQIWLGCASEHRQLAEHFGSDMSLRFNWFLGGPSFAFSPQRTHAMNSLYDGPAFPFRAVGFLPMRTQVRPETSGTPS